MCARQAIFTCFPRSSNAPPSRRLHMPALLKASMKTAVEAASSCEGKKKKKKQPTSHAWHTGGGADPAGAPGAGSESGVQFLAASPRKGGIQTWANVPRWRHPGSVTIAWFSSRNCLFLERARTRAVLPKVGCCGFACIYGEREARMPRGVCVCLWW